MEDLQQLAAALRSRRHAGGLTQQQLADAARIPRRTYQRLEAGAAGARVDSLLLSLRALGLQIELTQRQRPTLDQLATIYGNEERDEPAAS